jgi:UDP-2,3-diacylglucosamine pyrophosphatase LpxH
MRVAEQEEIKLVTGQRILVIHGHQFDRSMPLEPFGNALYEMGLGIDHVNNSLRRRLGRSKVSISDYVKRKVHIISSHLGDFRENGVKYARERGFDGLFCGHKHHGEVTLMDDDFMFYGNTGTFAGFPCTAIVGHRNGDISLTYWDDHGYVAQLTRTITAEQLAHAFKIREAMRGFGPELEACPA